MTSRRPTLRGVVFDMDGTLTIPNLDFAAMYAACNVPRDQDILAAVASMPPTEAAAANAIIEEMEEEGRKTLRLMPGAIELGRWLRNHGVPISLVTRNTAKTVAKMMDDLWVPAGGARFEHALSRDECNGLPPKPDPASLVEIAKHWSIDLPTQDVLMVGDSPAHDVGFGKAAGVSTALLDTDRRHDVDAGEHNGADLCVEEMWQLPRLLWQNFDIGGPLGTGVTLLKYPAPTPRGGACIAAHEGNVAALMESSREELCAVDESGNTPLIWAADMGHADAVQQLLTVPMVDVDARGYLGATAVCRASRRGHVEVLRILANEGKADLNIPNEKMQYPLHFAAFKEQGNAVALLLEFGANTLVLDRKGRTPAEDTGDEKIRERIVAARKSRMHS